MRSDLPEFPTITNVQATTNQSFATNEKMCQWRVLNEIPSSFQHFDSSASSQLLLSTKNQTNITAIININEQSILDGADPHDAWFTINGERYENGSYYDMDDWVYPTPPEPDGINTDPLDYTLVIPDNNNEDVEICLVDRPDYESCQLVTNNSEIVSFLYP